MYRETAITEKENKASDGKNAGRFAKRFSGEAPLAAAFYFPSVRGDFSFAFIYAAVRPFRSFGRVGLRRVPVSAARQRRRLFQDRHTPNDHLFDSRSKKTNELNFVTF